MTRERNPDHRTIHKTLSLQFPANFGQLGANSKIEDQRLVDLMMYLHDKNLSILSMDEKEAADRQTNKHTRGERKTESNRSRCELTLTYESRDSWLSPDSFLPLITTTKRERFFGLFFLQILHVSYNYSTVTGNVNNICCNCCSVIN